MPAETQDISHLHGSIGRQLADLSAYADAIRSGEVNVSPDAVRVVLSTVHLCNIRVRDIIQDPKNQDGYSEVTSPGTSAT
jgi:hypothetical protein